MEIIVLISVAIGYFIRVYIEVKKDKSSYQHFSLYCFQCEIEMPVKEYNGNFYCKKCGLIH